MSVELCKISLWMEAIEPGKPLSFIDHHILCGNSLIGATPLLLQQGIPDKAFEPIEGDDRAECSYHKKKNKQFRGGNRTLFDPEARVWKSLNVLTEQKVQLERMSDKTVEEYHRKEEYDQQRRASSEYLSHRLLADAWCAAFVWKKKKGLPYPITEEIFRKIEKGSSDIDDQVKEEIARLREQYRFFHWHLEFSDVFGKVEHGEEPDNVETGWKGGFDVVLSNPPWERIKIQEKEWFAQRRPAISAAPNAAQRRNLIKALKDEDPQLYAAFMDDQREAGGESHFVRDSDHYPLCGRGDVNTYALFAENMRSLINPRGRVGCIVPSGIATDDTTKIFFRDMTESHTLISLYSFENEEFIFPAVHHATKFCLLTVSGCKRQQTNADFVFFARQTADLRDEERHFTLSVKDISLLNPNTRTCAIFRSKRDMILTKVIYQRVPVLIKEGPPEQNPWGISFSTMFHMANDSHLFRTRAQLEKEGWKLQGNIFSKNDEHYLPLYEGKMVWHFDHRFGTYEGQTQAQANQGKLPEFNEQQHQNPHLLTMPHYWIHKSHLQDIGIIQKKVLLVFRDIARSTDARTAIFCILPCVPSGHKLPVVILNTEYANYNAHLATCFSSFIFDYVTRQKLGGTSLSYFILRQLPTLPPTQYQAFCPWDRSLSLSTWILFRALELTYTAWDLEAFAKECGYDGPPFIWDEERRFLLRCELDAAYFHLYGIKREDVDYIMETFPIVKRKDEKLHGEYRTKWVILAIYDKMKRAMESGEPYQTQLSPPPADPGVAHPPRLEVEA